MRCRTDKSFFVGRTIKRYRCRCARAAKWRRDAARCALMPTELDRRIAEPFNGAAQRRPRADTISFLAGARPLLGGAERIREREGFSTADAIRRRLRWILSE